MLIEPLLVLENKFTLAYYVSILKSALNTGYKFQTLSQFWDNDCPSTGVFVLRHDLDANSPTLKGILDAEIHTGVRSSIFVRVTANTYNPFDYRTFPILDRAKNLGFELGLHTNFVEFATFHDIEPVEILKAELTSLRAFFGDITSIACHRDLNYAYNSLPWLQRNWEEVSKNLSLRYEAYDAKIMDNLLFVNETAEQKLGWRSTTPEQAIETGRSICMSTHPHWWFKTNPFET